tara:strand:+ start:698 stop:2461 length:1764 start_codon:yes stop_codon:yes gene_type:complete
MKTSTNFLFVFFLFTTITFNLYSQTFSKSISPSVLSDSVIILNDESKVGLKQNYIIEANQNDSHYFTIVLKSDNGKSETFNIHPLSLELFSAKFRTAFLKLIADAETLPTDKTVSKAIVFDKLEISFLFAQLITFERTEDERPVVANITLKEDIPIRMLYNKTDHYKSAISTEAKKLKPADGSEISSSARKLVEDKITAIKKSAKDSLVVIKSISDAVLELTFYNGYIEKVELETELFSKKIRFTNTYSIGISSSNGIKNFTKNHILSFYKYIKVGNILKRDDSGSYLEVNFADIIDYDREIDINANDISPEPTRLRLDDSEKSTSLYKEQSTKLFEAIVYSDFLGVFDEDNPNGILQTEVAKKFYINTNRYAITPKGRFLGLLFPPIAFSEGYGWFEYVDVSAKISKLEENNKFLIADSLDSQSYFSPLRIMQHQAFSIGADINLLYLENQNKKINTNLDLGLRYGRSGLRIDERTDDFFNSITTSLQLGFQFIPEKRYGLLVNAEAIYFQVYNDDGFTLKSLENAELVKPKQWFNKTQFEFFVNTSNTGKLFIRYNFVTELQDWDNNFSQFQFGYSFYLLKQNGK